MNKKFKKTLSGILACTIIATSTVPAIAAWADGEDQTEPNASITMEESDLNLDVTVEVIGTIDPKLEGTPEEIEEKIAEITGDESEVTMDVNISWDDLLFVYDFGTVTKYDWNTNTLEYDDVEYSYVNGEGRGWNKKEANIYFENRSNRSVWTGVKFERNKNANEYYREMTMGVDKNYELLPSAVGAEDENSAPVATYTFSIDGKPEESLRSANYAPNLGVLHILLEKKPEKVVEPPAEPETTTSGEHECHFVYDQFGRLVCTGCNKIKHEYCIDEDEDGLCDECGLERDFCPDCHLGGTCRCL